MPYLDYLDDREFTDYTIGTVEKHEKSWSITLLEPGETKSCLGFGIGAEHGREPKPGERIRQWGKGFGYPVRGVQIGDDVLYYETEQEYHNRSVLERKAKDRRKQAEYEATGKAANDSRISLLPKSMQERIAGFRERRSDFGWMSEGYELFCLEQGLAIFNTLRTQDAIKAFHAAPYERQKELVPQLEDGHSGNTFGFSCRIASILTIEDQEKQADIMRREHGALCPLMGCEDYGCWAATVEQPRSEVVAG